MKKLLIRVKIPGVVKEYDIVDLIVEETSAGVDIRREQDPRCEADTSIVLVNDVILAVESADG